MITEREQKRLERYFGVEFTAPWPGGYVVYQDNAFIVAIPEECTFGQARNLLSHTVDRNTLARNIVAALFWEWRALNRKVISAHQRGAGTERVCVLQDRRDQAAKCFELAYGMVHPNLECA